MAKHNAFNSVYDWLVERWKLGPHHQSIYMMTQVKTDEILGSPELKKTLFKSMNEWGFHQEKMGSKYFAYWVKEFPDKTAKFFCLGGSEKEFTEDEVEEIKVFSAVIISNAEKILLGGEQQS